MQAGKKLRISLAKCHPLAYLRCPSLRRISTNEDPGGPCMRQIFKNRPS